MTTVTISNLDLSLSLVISSGNYVVSQIDHESAPPVIATAYQLARRNKTKLVNQEYTAKKITVQGYVTGSTKAVLENNLDTLKKYLSGSANTITIDYAGSSRTYTYEMTSFSSGRKGTDVTLASYTTELTVNDVFGKAAAQSSKILSAQTSKALLASFTSDGTFAPEPTYLITLNSADGLSSIKVFGVDGNYIRVADPKFTAGDMILVDTPNRRIVKTTNTADTYEEDFTGLFPASTLGGNNLQFTFSASHVNYNIDVSWFDRYL